MQINRERDDEKRIKADRVERVANEGLGGAMSLGDYATNSSYPVSRERLLTEHEIAIKMILRVEIVSFYADGEL